MQPCRHSLFHTLRHRSVADSGRDRHHAAAFAAVERWGKIGDTAEELGEGRVLSTDLRDFQGYRWKNTRPFTNLLLPP